MALTKKLATFFLLAVLVFIPLGSVQARSLQEGPIIGHSYTLKSGETLNEDLLVIGGSITLEKNSVVTGHIVLIGGSLIMNGEARQDVVLIGGAASLGANAHVYGDLVTIGAPISRETGSRVDGNLVNEPVQIGPADGQPTGQPAAPQVNLDEALNPFWKALNLLAQSFGLAVLAAILVLFLPQQTRRIGEAIPAQPALAGAIGLLGLLIFIAVMVTLALVSILIITLILTIPIIMALAVAFAAASVFGWVSLGTEIGLRFAGAIHREFPLPLTAAAGTFTLNLTANAIGFIPCVGWLAPTIFGLIALGAVLITRFGMRPLLPAASIMESSSTASTAD